LYRYTLIAADYSQIEFRILAYLTQDPQLIEFFKSGQDIHLQIASRLLGILFQIEKFD
jgi:DNA polymerase-1